MKPAMDIWRRLAERFLWTAAVARAAGQPRISRYYFDLAVREFYEYKGPFRHGRLRPRPRPTPVLLS